jgi:hypothetical protein
MTTWKMASTKASTKPDNLTRIRSDFRLFLKLVWDHIRLPEPTPLQYDIAKYLQHGQKKCCIEAFRGVGKSFVTSAYVLWVLLNDPQKKIMVVSASKNRADNFTTMTLRLIEEMPILAHLRPKPNQRYSKVEFDVGPALADQTASVRSLGITSQLTGGRADIIISDDVEVPNNSATPDMREKLLERIREYSAILKPLEDARIIYLGTPQTEESIYNQLPDTFETRIWPARVPNETEADRYGDNLAPYIKVLMQKYPSGSPTDPRRFSAYDLASREAEYGKTGFALQFMLNTQLSDTERYPLKVRDLFVMDVGDRAPMKLEWMPDDNKMLKKLPNLAMSGDRFYPPAAYSPEFGEFQGAVMAIDPSGRGKDETGYAVVKMLNGFLYVTAAGGLPGGYDNATLTKLASIAKVNNVGKVVIEANFGDGMYTQLIRPVLNKIHPCTVEEVKHSVQKEHRIIDTLEPVMARHRLVLDRKVIEEDFRTANEYEGDNKFKKALIYQLTRICYDKGALVHDDRLDALAIAVSYWTDRVAMDADRGLEARREELLMEDLERFMENALGQGPRNKSWVSYKGRDY